MTISRRTLIHVLAVWSAWTAVGLVGTAQTQLLLSSRGETRPAWSIVGPSLIGAWIWALYTPGVIWIARRLRGVRERRGSGARGWAAFLAAHAVVAAAGALVDATVWAGVRPLIDGVPLPWSRALAGTLLVNLASYLAVVTLTEAADHAARSRERERTAQALARTADALRQRIDEARLRTLEAQLRPHFLYNTLNLVAELVHEEPDEADAMLTHLGELLRRSYGASSHVVPLAEEAHFARAYAEILARRYRDRATLTIDVPASLAGQPVPTFLLQPLVENAFRHGVERREGASEVRIVATAAHDRLVIRVSDRAVARSSGRATAGRGRDDEPPDGAARGADGVGLRNTRERLALLYGGAAGLTLARASGATVASLWLPLAAGSSAAGADPHVVPAALGGV